jgi:hypothetical protein
MRHHHHHGDLRGWIVGGIGLALGYLIFHVLWTAVAMVGLIIWYATDNWKTAWRRGARTIFVVAVSLALFAGVLILLAE